MTDNTVTNTESDNSAQQNRLLNTINNVAAILLQAEVEKFENALLGCMKMMGEAVNVDRVYIWRNHTVDGNLYCTQLYEWSEGAEPQQDNEYTIDIKYSNNMPGWEEELSNNRCINGIVREMNAATQAQLSPQGILSILVVPVFLRERFWGFVGFDDCRSERIFSESEETILRSGSLLIAHALLRNDLTLGIRTTAKELEIALEEAQAANRAKSSFLSNMSHEMRTPMNAIIGMTQIGKKSRDIEKKDYAFEKIEGASNHMLGVINDVLDMSKIEAGKFELTDTEFEFEKMIQKAVNILDFRIKEKNLQFSLFTDTDIPKVFIGDDQRLTQVISNLLSNAVKFTPNHGSISLNVKLVNDEDGMCTLEIEVRDTGIGISPEHKSRLFTSFEQAENSISRQFGGTGLGLSICKRIVEMMGGQIWVDSEPGKGSVFAFTVRLIRGDEKDGEGGIGTMEQIYSFKGRRILLAEDVEINREIVLSLLEPAELEIDCAINGAEALKMFSSAPEKYDMIFMDMQMPQMDGLEATRKIRHFESKNDPTSFAEGETRRDRRKPIPIVAMTANVFKDDVDKCLDAGMNDHVGKPLIYNEVIDVLMRYLPSK